MDIKQKEIRYNVDLEAAETIEILINGNSVFSEEVPAGYKAEATLMYQESKV